MSGVPKQEQAKGADPAEVAWRGIELCRQGEWTDGLYWLRMAAGSDRKKDLPALFYSYFGYGIARYEKKQREGLRLCRRAVKIEFFQPEAFEYLARTYLLVGEKKNAAEAVEEGLALDGDSTSLLALREDLGDRRPPVLPFLGRGNILNRILGHLRHSASKSKSASGKGGAAAESGSRSASKGRAAGTRERPRRPPKSAD